MTVRHETQDANLSILMLLVALGILAAILGFVLYALLQPTRLSNPGMAAYKAPVTTSVALRRTNYDLALERLAVAAASEANAKAEAVGAYAQATKPAPDQETREAAKTKQRTAHKPKRKGVAQGARRDAAAARRGRYDRPMAWGYTRPWGYPNPFGWRGPWF